MKQRNDDNLIWESYNISTPVKPEDLTPAQSSVPATEVQPEQSSEPVPQVNKEDYRDFFRTDGTLPPEVQEIVLTIRDHVNEMHPHEEKFEENLDLYLMQLREAILQNTDL
jgi:hypothetical protein